MTYLITGANRGLGYETARVLAADPNRTIVLAGRDLPAIEAAARRLRNETGNTHLVPMPLDLADLDNVRAFAADLRGRDLPPLRALIANAGLSRSDLRARSAQGYELTFAVNHLGHFLLIALLLGDLEPPARIVIVSSGVHDVGEASRAMQPARYVSAELLAHPERDPDQPADDQAAGMQAYATSKLANLLLTYELARRLEAAGLSTPERPITVNAFDPGLMAGTGLGRDSRGFTRVMWYTILPTVSRLAGFGRSVRQSGSDLAWLASTPELANVTGAYFSGREELRSSADSYDLDKAADLWQTSVRLTGLTPQETILPL